MIWKHMCGIYVINNNCKIVQMNNTNIHLKLES